MSEEPSKEFEKHIDDPTHHAGNKDLAYEMAQDSKRDREFAMSERSSIEQPENDEESEYMDMLYDSANRADARADAAEEQARAKYLADHPELTQGQENNSGAAVRIAQAIEDFKNKYRHVPEPDSPQGSALMDELKASTLRDLHELDNLNPKEASRLKNEIDQAMVDARAGKFAKENDELAAEGGVRAESDHAEGAPSVGGEILEQAGVEEPEHHEEAVPDGSEDEHSEESESQNGPENDLEAEIKRATEAQQNVLRRLENSPNFEGKDKIIQNLKDQIQATEDRLRAQHEQMIKDLDALRANALGKAANFIARPGGTNFVDTLKIDFDDQGHASWGDVRRSDGRQVDEGLLDQVVAETAALIGAELPAEDDFETNQSGDRITKIAEVSGDPGFKLVIRELYKKKEGESGEYEVLVSQEVIVSKDSIQFIQPKS